MVRHTIGMDPPSSLFHGGVGKVRCADDLAIIRRLRNRRNVHILLCVPGLAVDKSSVWESRLNAALKECGCSLGAKFMCAALAGSIIGQSLNSSWSVPHWPGFLFRSLLAVLAASVMGKLSGLALAKRRLQTIEKQIREFESRLPRGYSDVNLHEMGG